MKDIVADLLNAANGYANKDAELLEAAASEIDLLRDELADCKRISSAAVGHQGSLLEAAIARAVSAEQDAENAYTAAEATIRAEIADGGTSCHWCLDKTAKAERERCVGLGFALHAALATEAENDYTRGYCDALRNYANAIEAMVSLGAKDDAATSGRR